MTLVANIPTHRWYRRECHNRIPRMAECKATLDDAYLSACAGGGGEVTTPFTAIDASGWKANYPTPPASFDPVGAPVTLAVTRSGFNAAGAPATVTDDVVVNCRLRQPYPNQNLLTASTVVLSERIYASDTLPAGVTNGSTLVYPSPIVCWDTHDHFPISGPTFTVSLFGVHRFARNGRPFAAVRIIAKQGAVTREVLVSSLTFLSYAASGLGADAYSATFTSADFLAALPITVNAQIYPWAGPMYDLAVNGNAAPNIKNTIVTGYIVTPMYAYLSTTGSDTTGVASATPATAQASPCLTIAGAGTKIRQANLAQFGRDEIGGGIIRFPVGTWVTGATDIGASAAHPITTACVAYEPYTIGDKATTILTDTGTTKSNQNLSARHIVRNLTLKKFAATGHLFRCIDAVTTAIAIENCTLDRNGQTYDANWINRVGRGWFKNCDEVGGSSGAMFAAGATLKNCISIGNVMSGNCVVSQIASKMTAVGIGSFPASVSVGYAQGMIMNCFVSGNDGVNKQVLIGGGATLSTPGLGFAITGTVIEAYGAVSAGAAAAWADTDGSTVYDFMLMANTIPCISDKGGISRLYNDTLAATAHKDGTMKMCVFGRSACKTDVFVGTTVSPGNPLAANCIGNWEAVMGVGHAYNTITEGQQAPNSNIGPGSWRFETTYPGIQIGDGLTTPSGTGGAGYLNPLWTLDASADGTQLGGGDYRPLPASPLRRVPAGMTIAARDARGKAIPTDGTAFVGALQPA